MIETLQVLSAFCLMLCLLNTVMLVILLERQTEKNLSGEKGYSPAVDGYTPMYTYNETTVSEVKVPKGGTGQVSKPKLPTLKLVREDGSGVRDLPDSEPTSPYCRLERPAVKRKKKSGYEGGMP